MRKNKIKEKTHNYFHYQFDREMIKLDDQKACKIFKKLNSKKKFH